MQRWPSKRPRCFCWRACQAVDVQSPGAQELAIEAKVHGSETAVRVLTDLMRVVGIESYDHALPLGRLLQDALALPLFGGGNIGVRRRQLHGILKRARIRSADDQRRGGGLIKRSFRFDGVNQAQRKK